MCPFQGGFLNLSKVDGFLNLSKVDGFLNLSKVDGFLNLSKVEVCSFDPGKEKTFVDPVDWDFGREFIDTFFEVNDVLCRFDYNYESVCDADLQLNQIIVSVVPVLFLARDFESLCEWPDALECSHRLIESGIHTRD